MSWTRNLWIGAGLVAVAGLGVGDLAAEEVPEKLTWMDCVAEAVKSSPDIEAAWRAVQNSDALRKGAYSDFFPQVTAGLDRTRTYSPAQGTIVSGGGATAFGSATSVTEYATQYTANLTVQQLIFDGFNTKGKVDQAKAQARLALANLASEKALVSYELKSAFAQLLYAQNLIQISESIVKQRSLDYRLVDLRYESGKENKGAVLLSKANLTQAEFDLEQARRNAVVSQRQLLVSMGRSNGAQPVVAVGDLVTAPIQPQSDFKALAIQTPAHHQRIAEKDAAAAGITIAQSSLYPQVSLSGAFLRQDDKFFPNSSGWSVGLAASWTLFDSGKTFFNVKAARASLQQSLALLRSSDDQTALSLAKDYANLIDAVDSVRVQQEMLDAAALRARIAEAQYRNGLISFQDFDTITTDYINKQRTFLAIRREAVVAEATWEQSRGVGAIP